MPRQTKGPGLLPGLDESTTAGLLQGLLQLVRGRLLEARWPDLHGRNRVAVGKRPAARWAIYRVFQVGQDVRGCNGSRLALLRLGRPHLNRAVNLLQIGRAE